MTRSLSRRSLLGTTVAATGALAWTAGAGHAAAASPAPRGMGPEAPPALAFHLLPAPVRAYDSRVGQVPDGTDSNTGAGDTALVRNETRTLDISYVLGHGADPTGVPTSAYGVLMNVTAVNTTGVNGYLKVWSDDVAEPNASSLNWDHAAAVVANLVTSACADGYVRVRCGGATGAGTNLIVDVIGYYEISSGPF